jgi:hypothetical protein
MINKNPNDINIVFFFFFNIRALCLIKCERFGNLVELATKSHELPQVAKRGLMRSIVHVGAVLIDADQLQQYFSQILQPLQNRFKNIICNTDFSRNYHQEDIRVQIIEILECIIGKFKYFAIYNIISFNFNYVIYNYNIVINHKA